VEAKVSAEATRVFGDATREPTREAVDTMDYTLATLKEVLRLYSVVPVVTRVTVVRCVRWRARTAVPWHARLRRLLTLTRSVRSPALLQADDTLGTCFIPAGTRIILSLQGVHHRADLWPEPKTFRVERFLPGQEVDTYAFLAFIQGPRNCLGQYLALLEARVVLGVLSQVRAARSRRHVRIARA
jgi:cytochrome P450